MKRLPLATLHLAAAISVVIPDRMRTAIIMRFPRVIQGIRTAMKPVTHAPKESLSTRLDLNRMANQVPLTINSSATKPPLLVYTPYAPSRNGIGNYSRLLIESLRKETRVGIRVSGQTAYAPLADGVYSALWDDESWFNGKRIYMLGNGPEHLETWEAMHRYPGHVILHDPRIQDIPLLNGEEERWSYRPSASTPNAHAGRIPQSIQSIIVHSMTAKEILSEQFEAAGRIPGPEIRVLKTGHPFPNATPRSRGSDYSSKPVIGTLGFQTPSKLPELTYRLMAKIGSTVNAKGIICGEIPRKLREYAVKTWVRAGNSIDDLEVITNASDEDFESVAKSIDLGIQLRAEANGESSGPVALLLSSGTPTIVSGLGAFLEIQTEALIFWDNKERNMSSVSDVAAQILRNPELYNRLSADAQSYAVVRGFDVAAREILDIVNSYGSEEGQAVT